LDTETTGNESEDELIEIGLVMLDVPSLHQLGEFTVVVQPSKAGYERMMAKDVVREMHEKNGLLADVQGGYGVHPDVADAQIMRWLDQFAEPRSHIPYGGSGVAHFDRQYIAKFLPRLNKRITYWALDVGSVRRIFALQGASTASIEAKTHRALDDAKVHADELRFYAERGRKADAYDKLLIAGDGVVGD
jgi:oligoribonuclease (3'-5' exoribonuclease)